MGQFTETFAQTQVDSYGLRMRPYFAVLNDPVLWSYFSVNHCLQPCKFDLGNDEKRFIRLICYDLAQLFYYVVTLIELTGVNTGIKIKKYSLDTILCILLGLCCLLLSMQSLQTYINGSYKISLECVANLCAFLYIGGNYLAYVDRESMRNNNFIKQSTGRTRYYPPRERPKPKIRK